MIAVIFEAVPADDQLGLYLDIAARLKPELSKIEGFISIERFQSLSTPGKVLSLSFWEDEQAVEQWRNMEMHRSAQAMGRSTVFNDYQIRIAQVFRNYTRYNREEAPSDSRKVHG
ncbi:MAG: antibiotic biosynthesis monooxygenase family protein [Candidatus Saccharimonadales bacterium]